MTVRHKIVNFAFGFVKLAKELSYNFISDFKFWQN